VHDTGEAQVTAAPTELPAAAWALAWSFVVGQLVSLVMHGTQPAEDWPLSSLLGVVVVAFFSYGVLRARMVRFWLVTVLNGVALVVFLVVLLDGGTLADLVDLVMTAVQLGCLVWLYRTPWFAWQRTRPAGGPSIRPLMLLAVLVGVLAGVIGTDSAAVRVDVNL
jgi:hypothetical protein